jgi:uncharacterized protein (DUF58 family)
MRAAETLNRLLNVDFCPWANRYVYWLKQPIGWVVLAFIASLLLGIYVSAQAFLAAAAIAAIGIIGCVWPWIAMQGIRGELSWAVQRCDEGESVRTTLELVNRLPIPAFGLFIETDHAIASQSAAPEEPICLSQVPPLAKSWFDWDCSPKRRGMYPKQTVRLATAFPFGVWTCYRRLEVSAPLIVWPHRVRLIDTPESNGAPSVGIGAPSTQTGDEGDWMGVRPYRPGDALRQVHWAQTARRDSLVVFERQARARQEVSIYFDSQAAHRIEETEQDEMLRILASLTQHFMNHSWLVHVHFNQKWQSLRGGHASRQAWLDQLAQWTPDIDALAFPSVRPKNSTLHLGITTVARLEEIPSSIEEPWEKTWFALESRRAGSCSINLSGNLKAIVLPWESSPLDALDANWRSFCRNSGVGSLSMAAGGASC